MVSLAPRPSGPRRIALGVFDGVHVGHRAVMEACDTVVTFAPHPLRVLRPTAAPPLLTSLTRRAELIGELGIAELVVLRFDDRLAAMGAEQFVEQVLVARLAAASVAVGANFRFGHRGAGSPELLSRDPRFVTATAGLRVVGDAVVSSTRIRRLLAAGAVAEAGELLGRPFVLEVADAGIVDRGRTDGVAVTARVASGYVVPAGGEYAATAVAPSWSAPSTVRISGDPARPAVHAVVQTERRGWRAGDVRLELRHRLGPGPGDRR